jgi:cyclohexanone monooxygenase
VIQRYPAQLDTRVTAARFDEAANRSQIETDRGDHVSARFCIMATGCLSSAQVPAFPGLESFTGTTYHTGHWPHSEVDFSGQRVGVIGTGSSAIQSIPIIARQAASLVVFQRTPNFTVPAHNAPLDPEDERRVKADYAEFRRRTRESRVGFVVSVNNQSALAVPAEERQREYEMRWQRGGLGFAAAYTDLLTRKEANDTAAEFFRSKIRATVCDAAVAEPSSLRTIPSAPSTSASTPTTTRRSTATTSPWSISAASQSRRSLRGVCEPGPPSTTSTASSSPPASMP